MPAIKENILENDKARLLVRYGFLLSALGFLPLFIHVQWLTGPIVNALLVLILFIIGKREAVIACCVPSFMALASGFLPVILAPLLPFIIIGNIIYILCIEFIYNKIRKENLNFWAGVTIGATLKFAFIFICLNIISGFVISQKINFALAQMMSWMQFATALLGGLIAWIILKWLKRL